jgi:Holliday junction resolvasome RuvABC endonuclease subunit
MMPGVLALDPGTLIGWAHAEPGETPTFGHKRLARSGVTPGQFGSAFDIFLQARLDLFKPRYVCYEKPWVGRKSYHTVFRLLGMASRIETMCDQWGIGCREAAPQEISSFFLGTGGLKTEEKKRRTVEMCRAYGWDAQEDEADALALLVYAEAKLFPAFRLKRRVAAGPLFPPAKLLTTAAESVQRS